MTSATTLHGSCHCGQLNLQFSTAQDPASLVPRACDCSFCRKHGAAYISDPAGRLSIHARGGALRHYQQGSNNADFLVCGCCGVLVAVVFEHLSRLYGAVNAGCLDGKARLAEAVPASPQMLSADDKISRWIRLWVPDVELSMSDAEIAAV
ncbi:MAG: aldehyde-activating protein [Gammaproteobacteria bacterium]|nr:MAG: aldehyde-activating protein [Gammaproteobacteria bacterium]